MKANFSRSRRVLYPLLGILALLIFSNCAGEGVPLIAIEINPLCIDNFNPGDPAQFNACVFIDGVRQPGFENDAVTWSVFGGDVNGTITQDGAYQSPNTNPPPTSVVTIMATSKEDTQKMGTASIIFTGQGECEAFNTPTCQ